ncbi:MAG TPA: allantoate amidohydrolase [Roseiflexaceae bacterium]|nr:allantoate amidohydrolase [Roseiflexaceae bacterium]
MSADEYARVVMRRCDLLATFSEETGCVTRRFATPALRQASDEVAAWMRAAGMQVREDNIGNLIGRYEAERPGAKTLLLGSHLDSVRDAGRYDGPLGVLVALAAVERLNDRGRRLPFAIEVLAFADEEGVRYHTAYLGSQVFAGRFDSAQLILADADGVRMAEAIRAYGGDPARLASDARRGDDLLGYCEVHIEQGPALEARGLPVGVVMAIAGQSRFTLTFVGQAGHAGTVPMDLRRDALVGAAEFIGCVNAYARREPGLVATVGQIDMYPNVSNVIPGRVTISLDVRHQDDQQRARAIEQLRMRADEIATASGVQVSWDVVQENRSVPCSTELMKHLGRAIEALGQPVWQLPSGAGHDGVMLSSLTPIAMLFVRCKGGVSHNPAEAVTEQDVAVAIEVLGGLLQRLESGIRV